MNDILLPGNNAIRATERITPAFSFGAGQFESDLGIHHSHIGIDECSDGCVDDFNGSGTIKVDPAFVMRCPH